MTDVVAQNLWVDGVVAAAPNLALLYGVLPPMPVEGQMAIYTGSAFSGLGGWDAGIPFPSGQGRAASVAVDPTTGDILAVLTTSGGGAAGRRIFRYTSLSWDSGLGFPSGTYGAGLTVRPNGNILTVYENPIPKEIWEYANGTWTSTGVSLPTAATAPHGLALTASGAYVIADDATNRIYTYSGGSWDAGVTLPTGVSQPRGVAVNLSGEYLYIDRNQTKVYTRSSGGVWDAGVDFPVGSGSAQGLGVQVNGGIVIVVGREDRIYTLAVNNAMLPAARGLVRWTGATWENL